MKKKGFTLIELLAVIVVLAIIAIIAIPIITNVIEKARSSALKDSAYGLIEAANLYYATSITKGEDFDETTFNLVDGKLKSGSKELNYKGQSFKGSSYVAINEVGSVELMITDGKYYASKEYDEVNITMSDSQDDALTREELTTKLNEANEKITALETKISNINTKLESQDMTFIFTNSSYFESGDPSVTTFYGAARRKGDVISFKMSFVLRTGMTAYTEYSFGKINDWNYGERYSLAMSCVSGHSMFLKIKSDGTITAANQTTVVTGDVNSWYFIDTVFIK